MVLGVLKAPRRHPGDTQEAREASRRHPGTTQGTQEAQEASDRENCNTSQLKCKSSV